ncbi:MAG: PH domain-containing protein [Candidatus Magasanikbacteria bacterium]|nr:PH domain-containing protein [Candidatus Magasanikbacteria bacterium]
MHHLSETIHQEANERIKLLLRRHPITFIPKILLVLILLAIPPVVGALFEQGLLADPFWGPVLVLLGSGYILLILTFFHALFVDYYLDVWVVTNDRIIDIHQAALFKRTVAELDLKQVQDVTSKTVGVFGTFFDFGDVSIQTAGAKEKFIFQNVPKPHFIRGQILKLAELDAREDAEEAKGWS